VPSLSSCGALEAVHGRARSTRQTVKVRQRAARSARLCSLPAARANTQRTLSDTSGHGGQGPKPEFKGGCADCPRCPLRRFCVSAVAVLAGNRGYTSQGAEEIRGFNTKYTKDTEDHGGRREITQPHGIHAAANPGGQGAAASTEAVGTRARAGPPHRYAVGKVRAWRTRREAAKPCSG
jgi:hypothetical protein